MFGEFTRLGRCDRLSEKSRSAPAGLGPVTYCLQKDDPHTGHQETPGENPLVRISIPRVSPEKTIEGQGPKEDQGAEQEPRSFVPGGTGCFRQERAGERFAAYGTEIIIVLTVRTTVWTAGHGRLADLRKSGDGVVGGRRRTERRRQVCRRSGGVTRKTNVLFRLLPARRPPSMLPCRRF